ncbi:hypothetical protein nbrc107696_11620 [Gordonia spumicola]|uniref:Uncharacterized protein n=1 Tax=Gordonia spumicola TaxID=589161 RepID=A0A7I9V5P7_9ACTN|nr:hypothetical protein nbrc107696_11620 [Gordonia spumicola]
MPTFTFPLTESSTAPGDTSTEYRSNSDEKSTTSPLTRTAADAIRVMSIGGRGGPGGGMGPVIGGPIGAIGACGPGPGLWGFMRELLFVRLAAA